MFTPHDPMHPGELLSEILEEHSVSQSAFARMIGVSAMTVSRVARGERPVTAKLAVLFGAAFDQSPEMWLGLQQEHDLAKARREARSALRSVKRIAA